MTSLVFWVSRLPVGSSAKISEGRVIRARPMATRCCCPPESWLGRCFRRSFRFSTVSSSSRYALLKETSRKYEQTILMITHNRSIAQTADRVLQVSDGCLTDFGRCRE